MDFPKITVSFDFQLKFLDFWLNGKHPEVLRVILTACAADEYIYVFFYFAGVL